MKVPVSNTSWTPKNPHPGNTFHTARYDHTGVITLKIFLPVWGHFVYPPAPKNTMCFLDCHSAIAVSVSLAPLIDVKELGVPGVRRVFLYWPKEYFGTSPGNGYPAPGQEPELGWLQIKVFGGQVYRRSRGLHHQAQSADLDVNDCDKDQAPTYSA